MYMHSQCGSVFINAFLQYSYVATLDVLGGCERTDGQRQTDRCNAARCLFLWDVCLTCQEERDGGDAGRLHISVMSSSDVRRSHMKVLLDFCDVRRGNVLKVCFFFFFLFC